MSQIDKINKTSLLSFACNCYFYLLSTLFNVDNVKSKMFKMKNVSFSFILDTKFKDKLNFIFLQ